MRISEQFESYNHYNVLESELKELAKQVNEKLSQCRIGYTFLNYSDYTQTSYLIVDKSLWRNFEQKFKFGEHKVRLLSLSEIYNLRDDWQFILDNYYSNTFNKYTELINRIHWIDLDVSIEESIMQDKLIALLSLFDSILEEYSEVGKKDKAESRRELERLYHITYNLCNIINKYVVKQECKELIELNKELKIFRTPLVLDSRDGKGKYAELIRFCKVVNWNRAGFNVLIKSALTAISTNNKIIENNG